MVSDLLTHNARALRGGLVMMYVACVFKTQLNFGRLFSDRSQAVQSCRELYTLREKDKTL